MHKAEIMLIVITLVLLTVLGILYFAFGDDDDEWPREIR